VIDDLKFALRMLRKSPSVTIVAVLTLAIAIGASTSIFSAVSAMLLRPLPFAQPGELVSVQDLEPGLPPNGPSWAEFEDWRTQAPDLVALAAYRQATLNLTGAGEPQVIDTMLVSRGFFETLGLRPVVGRFFVPDEHVPNGAPALVAGEGLWHSALGGAAPGTTVVLDGIPFTLVGVAPAEAATLAPSIEAYVTLERKLPWTDRGTHYLETVARLAPGVTLARARADIAAAAPRIAAAAKATHLIYVEGLQENLRGGARPLLLLLLSAVGLVLLIAAVNLANLVLSRATGRVREFAVRRALGASGARLARQILVENGLLGLLGGALGVLFALWGRDAVVRMWPSSLPALKDAPLDARVLLFATLSSVGAGLSIGLVPALQAARGDLSIGLKEGAGASSRGRASGVLVVAQSALAVLLLAGAVLVIQSLSRMLSAGPGYRFENALSLRVPLPPSKYKSDEQRARFFADLLARVSALPDVRAAGVVQRVPLGGGSSNGNFSVVGRPEFDQEGHEPFAEKRVASEGYFAAMQIPILRGRAFSDLGRERTAVINQALARRIFPGQDPLGQLLCDGTCPEAGAPRTIVGVAGDVKQRWLNKEAEPEIYYPESLAGFGEMDLVVRGDGAPMALLPAVKAQIALIDPEQPVTKVRTLTQVIERSAGPQRLAAQLLTAFAAAALLLAVLGIYGVVSYAVSRREKEIGVRMALGAQAADVLRMVVGQGLRLSAAGALAGVAAALLLSRLLAGFLYGISATDPATYLGVAAALVLAAAGASLLPARRATRVDPIVALKAE
jgi:predicted permease